MFKLYFLDVVLACVLSRQPDGTAVLAGTILPMEMKLTAMPWQDFSGWREQQI